MSRNLSLYLHIPFCRHRCSYCDFNTYAGKEALRPAYVDALCREIRSVAGRGPARQSVHSIFFGGGTPSLLLPGEVAQILETIGDQFSLTADVEISMEANPGTVSRDYLSAVRGAGVNRLSMGMQSAHPDDLRLLERQHDFLGVIQSVKWARQAGFENLNLDLMFGLPDQPFERWKDTLEAALRLGTEHLSLYALTLEHGTPFQHWMDRGLIPEIDSDLAADMYEHTMERLDQAGFVQYEISNWARQRSDGGAWTCRHNLQYWDNQPYLGFGAGAHGYAAGTRTANVLGISAFIERCQTETTAEYPIGPAVANVTPIDHQTEIEETMMVGLRLTQAGVSGAQFAERFGVPLGDLYGKEIADLLAKGLIERLPDDPGGIRLTKRGRLLGNQVFMRFVGDG
ncbi:MAG TPA: radical SAM family heme chaperone HemW [Anaerolineaceae bacterium]|nr:radical SAM family heme chaperone HemW [Anaerolineaceae bacterium]